MSNISIPSAKDPHGNMIPIEEAERHKLNYYRCPECGEFINPRKGPQRQYFAHKKGVLENTNCTLSSQADVDRMVDDLRTSDIEKDEKERNIRVYLREEYEGHIDCFGIIPSLEWEQIPPQSDTNSLLEQLKIETVGVKTPPVPQNFHPSESETIFSLDPTEEEFRVSISGPPELDSLLGNWTADGLAEGDMFVGDQGRARRHRSNRQIKEGEWVYLVMNFAPPHVPDLVEKTSIGDFDLLSLPARKSTEQLLEEYGEGLTTDAHGFDADVLLPAVAHPTIEAPLGGEPGDSVLVGVTPSEGLDPVFEVVSIPKQSGDIVDLKQTGSGNPRYWTTSVPTEGSRRVSIHQRNSNRHRMIHLHSEEDGSDHESSRNTAEIGLVVNLDDDDPSFLSPLGGVDCLRVTADFEPAVLPTIIEYRGPDRLRINVCGTFTEGTSMGPLLRRTIQSIEEFTPELSHWVREGCKRVQFELGGIGTVSIEFPQPEVASTLSGQRTSNS